MTICIKFKDFTYRVIADVVGVKHSDYWNKYSIDTGGDDDIEVDASDVTSIELRA
ncbi:hypothetical protein ACQUFY_05905 [Robbsia andropogonis]|uniref:hypothetical protein n=1 Tax=Robbsia andropogonis TaxID=28092 RepID=UPI003D1A7EBB